MEPRASLGGEMALPKSLVDVGKLRRKLTLKYVDVGETADDAQVVEIFREDGEFIYVPRQLGLSICNQFQIPWDDCTSLGEPAKFPSSPTLRDYQIEPMTEILSAFDDYYDVVFKARTAFGKSLTALWLACQLKRATLIIVDQENLRDQWIKEAMVDKLGWPMDIIGVVQGAKVDYRKPVVVATVQTLVSRSMPDDFYNRFGLVIFDEVQVYGSPTFQAALRMFPASYRYYVSATTSRAGAGQKALEYNAGPVRVEAKSTHKESSVYVVRNPTVYSWYGNVSPKAGRIITEVSEDGPRNMLIAQWAMRMVGTGRSVLVVSERVQQLREIRDLLYYMGVDDDDMGMYTKYQPLWRVLKDENPKRLPEGYESGTEYTPVKVGTYMQTTKKDKLAHIKQNCKYVLATYQMFSKGVDAPHLMAGIDATFRSKATQVKGRIGRSGTEGMTPIWVTILDENNYRAIHAFLGRAVDYLGTKSVLYDVNEKGDPVPCPSNLLSRLRERKEELESTRIEPNGRGTFSLTTKHTSSGRGKAHAAAIKKRIQSVRRGKSSGDSQPQE